MARHDVEEISACVGAAAGALYLGIVFGFSFIAVWGGIVGGGIVGWIFGIWPGNTLLKPREGNMGRLMARVRKIVLVVGETLGGALVGMFYSLPAVGLVIHIAPEHQEAIWALGTSVVGVLIGSAVGVRRAIRKTRDQCYL
ncbi:MAG: hypothetical protein FI707_15790 [SAR202 cluster bacterium]|jgi:hypothetical protein|nr:hypothetical protein [SAR202 cluster bacterium]MQG59130.1 hypothetical protein [SAR202 cluster bacterium]MQG70239.1 hypothetical protein [SAR202 cluster bacterium]HAL48321.1 hypothetical protein [Dehalococcoidia bacterium]|tara:strand:+ start:5152 stop:5574 length:423 start_codon:yes stop_codon:yes gene_type:complete